ncbi:MAG: hypothetical protein PHR25_03740 [Clostridia bacterium]|nr:hypothetical protein [Clostridia bacterium]MDD4375874.1 hypothetical protein [Clostridia bacterium]
MLIPLKGKIIANLTEEKKETKSGLVLNNQSDVNTKQVIIYSVSQDLNKGLRKGDKAIISNFSGVEFKYENTTYIVLEEKEILAIIKEV